jgi:hypothetical protein
MLEAVSISGSWWTSADAGDLIRPGRARIVCTAGGGGGSDYRGYKGVWGPLLRQRGLRVAKCGSSAHTVCVQPPCCVMLSPHPPSPPTPKMAQFYLEPTPFAHPPGATQLILTFCGAVGRPHARHIVIKRCPSAPQPFVAMHERRMTSRQGVSAWPPHCMVLYLCWLIPQRAWLGGANA